MDPQVRIDPENDPRIPASCQSVFAGFDANQEAPVPFDSGATGGIVASAGGSDTIGGVAQQIASDPRSG